MQLFLGVYPSLRCHGLAVAFAVSFAFVLVPAFALAIVFAFVFAPVYSFASATAFSFALAYRFAVAFWSCLCLYTFALHPASRLPLPLPLPFVLLCLRLSLRLQLRPCPCGPCPCGPCPCPSPHAFLHRSAFRHPSRLRSTLAGGFTHLPGIWIQPSVTRRLPGKDSGFLISVCLFPQGVLLWCRRNVPSRHYLMLFTFLSLVAKQCK